MAQTSGLWVGSNPSPVWGGMAQADQPVEQVGTCLQIGSGVTLQQLLVYMQSEADADARHGAIWKVFANTLSRIAGKFSVRTRNVGMYA